MHRYLRYGLLEGMARLQDIPGVLVQGKLDVSGPAATAWQLHKLWPGHGGPTMIEKVVEAVAEFLPSVP